ncbi:MAG: dTDP-glucose 4,6-dehydratase [Candidatus Moraniibacteriota bacterium]|nr:MAG: dTDP-glucose 4,6-dehydratase [Candidatus Moranbacteria bacterium]
MKLFVTGGCGFIGSNFIHYILEKYPQDEVINYDLLTYAGNPENLKNWKEDSRYSFIHGDICDKEKLILSMKNAHVDVIVHFAAESHVDRSITDATSFVKTNVLGTQTLLEVARILGIPRFHHVSTDEVFGALHLEEKAFDEKTPYNPRSPYSASKAGSDHFVRAYFETYGLPVTLSNCSNNYGPFHYPEKLIPLAITNVLNGKKIPLYGEGNQIRDWLYVKDHCRAINVIIRKGLIGETYCIGGGNQPTNKEIILLLLNILGFDEEMIEYVSDRPGHDFRYDMNYEKIKKDLQWEPSISLEEGLRETVRWYKENVSWWKNV